MMCDVTRQIYCFNKHKLSTQEIFSSFRENLEAIFYISLDQSGIHVLSASINDSQVQEQTSVSIWPTLSR